MPETVIVGILSLAGSLIATLSGILIANKLTNYRIEQLEIKVDKHNNFAGRVPVIEEQIKVCNHRLEDLEHKLEG